MALTQTSAGGIIFRHGKDETELCLIRDDYGYWTFPKGKLEPGETPQQAAVREVGEEIGLTPRRVVTEVGATSYRFRIGDQVCRKTVRWFLMEAPTDAQCTPVPAERVRDAGWFPSRKAVAMAGYRNLRPILRRALRLLRDLG
jgi:diadenosine hexaphosphate hydrolase (ATP-forming)